MASPSDGRRILSGRQENERSQLVDTLARGGLTVRATVTLDDDLFRTAQEYSGVTGRTALIRAALKALIEREASRRLAAREGTVPDLEDVRRTRVED